MNQTKDITEAHHLQMYKRYPITLVKGEGVCVYDDEGKVYIDALAGIAVNTLGHSHPKLVSAIQQQAEKLIHISNLYYNEPQARLAKLLTEYAQMDKVFFCNSGAEANEGAVKLARKYAHVHKKEGPIISVDNCFHGRTLGTIALGKSKYQTGFTPMPEGFLQTDFHDLEAIEKAAKDGAIAVMLEPIQGEGGIYPHENSYLEKLREICDAHDMLLIFDEVQCGIGRTGKNFAFHHTNIKPDLLTSAKALGGGFPIGAVLCSEKVGNALNYGEHGTTYGGNPLGCAAAEAVIKTVLEDNLASHAHAVGERIKAYVNDLAKTHSFIKEIRGKGLMLGIQLDMDGAPVVVEMMKRGVLANCTAGHTIRLVPPLIITETEMRKVIDCLIESVKSVKNVK